MNFMLNIILYKAHFFLISIIFFIFFLYIINNYLFDYIKLIYENFYYLNHLYSKFI